MTPDLKALALAAVEARKTLKWKEIEPYLVEFERAATPERILQYRNDVLEEAANTATAGWLVPPDGGSPTKPEIDLCDHIAAAIRSLKTPEPT